MSSRSLSTSKLGVQKAKQALTGKRLTQRSLVGELGYAWATISKFFNGKPVDRLIFIEICQYLDLNWQDVIDNDGIATEDTAPLSTELLTLVQTQAIAARAVLTPRILQRIPRQVVAERYRPAIARGVTGNLERVIPLIAPAGYGKSTVLGQLYDELQETDAGWIGLILCSDLNVTQAALPTILGQAFAAINRPITELAAELNQIHGRGILLMDTLDLVISPVFVNDFIPVLRSLIAQGTTVVFTCRDHEYGEFLNREKLLSFAERVDHHRVPEFDEQEIRQAAAAFLTQQEGQPQGEAFAENILNLSADSRPLRQIIQNPLLLALLCELFAREGHVPSDLTVSKLYQRYWSEKVAYSRSESSTTSAKALEKERLCLAIAKSLFQISTQMLTESIYWDDLEIPLTETVSAAYADLLSEGVLYVHSNKIHFFHQTLLEYAIAYWLTRRSAHILRQPWLTLLKSTEAARTQTFWYPVLRQHLTLVEETEFEQLVDDLGTSNLGTFGAIAFAAASRDQPQSLQKLLPIALELSDSYQKRLRQALESVSRHLLYAIWSMLMTFLEQSRHATAINTAKTLSLLFSRWWVTLSDRLPMALDAIARRSATAHQGKDDRTQLVGWLLQECFAGMEQTLNPQLLAAFQQHYFLLGHRTACQVIRLYQTASVPSAFQVDLLEVMMQRELPNFTELEDATIAFLVTILLQTDADHLLYAPFKFLYAKFPKRWATAQAKAIGRLAAQQPELIQPLLKTLLINPEESGEQLRQGFTAIAESIVAGADDEIADFLTQLQLENLSKSSLSAIARFLRLCAPDFSPYNQEQLTCWLQPYLTDYLDDVIPIMNALSEISLTARELVHSNFERLPEAKQFHYRIKLLQFQPLEDHPKLSNLDKESQLLLIPYYRSLNHPDIPKILFQACQSHFKEVALAASWEIEIWGRDFVEASHALVLLRSRFPGLQERGLTLLLNWLQQEKPISDETITEVCSALAKMENPAIACLFYESISIWVQRFKRVPPGVVETVERSLFEMIRNNQFDGGPARVAILALKAIAQTESPSLDAAQLYQLVKSVLTSVSLIKIPNSEPEVINLISAIVRLRGDLLHRTVEEMGPVLVSQQWWRNLSAIIRTIRRIEGTQSNLLDEILQSEWCSQELESLILEVRGI
jgi:DNA-binding Xre family transcriptional regulator